MKKKAPSLLLKSHLPWILVLASACLLVLLPAVWCWYGPLGVFRSSTAPKSFPDTQIVYKGKTGIGFVNIDGSGIISSQITLGYSDFVGTWQTPIMMSDGKTIFVTYASFPGSGGKIFAVRAGEQPVDCGWYGEMQISPDGSHILVGNILATEETKIEKYLPEDCGTGNPPEKVYFGVAGALSPNEQYDAVASFGRYIVIRDLNTGEERRIGEGAFPVWSRDGEWLAYTGVDGIYIVLNGSDAEPKRLVELESPTRFNPPVYQEDRMVEYYPPIASWSPDGQWLVYHEYSYELVAPDAGAWAGHYSIFKVNVETGERIKLLEGGYSPSWRWPAEAP